MGLAQKRISQDYQQNVFPEWKNKITNAMGFEVPLEVKWDTMMDDQRDNKELYFSSYDSVYFKPLVAVMQNICADDMGREALKGALKKIVIDGTDGYSPGATTFSGGVLTINHQFCTNVDDVDARIQGWTKLLEKNL